MKILELKPKNSPLLKMASKKGKIFKWWEQPLEKLTEFVVLLQIKKEEGKKK